MDAGILILVTHVMLRTKSELLKQKIDQEFFTKLDETDVEYHQ